MPINRSVRGDEIGRVLEIEVEFTGTDCVPGDKYKLTVPGVTLATAEQEIPLSATRYLMAWRSDAPLTAGLTSPLQVQLLKTHGAGAGPAPISTFQFNLRPAPAAPAAPAAAPAPGAPAAGTPPAAAAPTAPATPQPFQVQIVGGPSSASRWINGAGLMGWLGGLVILLVILAFLWIVTGVITPAALNGLGGTSAIPTSHSSVVTTVEQRVISNDPAVLKEAAEASANISH